VQAHPDDDEATWNYDPPAESDDTENEDDEGEAGRVAKMKAVTTTATAV